MFRRQQCPYARLHLEGRRGFQSDDGHGDRQEVPHGIKVFQELLVGPNRIIEVSCLLQRIRRADDDAGRGLYRLLDMIEFARHHRLEQVPCDCLAVVESDLDGHLILGEIQTPATFRFVSRSLENGALIMPSHSHKPFPNQNVKHRGNALVRPPLRVAWPRSRRCVNL